MKPWVSIFIAVGSVWFFSFPAAAQGDMYDLSSPAPAQGDMYDPPTEPADELHQVAVTLSPIHLFVPILEVTGEYRLDPRMGAALMAGIGSIESGTSTFSVWEIGAQFRYYAVGNFDHGMQVGAELTHLGVSTSSSSGNVDLSASAAGTTFGGFVGYKYVATAGFTLDIQLGYQVMVLEAEAEATFGGSTESAERSDSGAGVLLNLNTGWSF